MTAVLLAILSVAVVGLPIALAVERSLRGPLLVGLAFLYGSGAVFAALLALAAAGIHWTLPAAAATILGIAVLAWLLALRRRAPAVPRRGASFHLLDLGTALTLAAYALYATLAPVWQWDFWAIWGLKAKLFFERGGIDWRFLEDRWNAFVHPDYPLLLPLNYDFIAMVSGGWSDRWLGIESVAVALALLLVVRGLAVAEAPRNLAALITFALTSIAASRYVGLAEGVLIAFGTAGVLLLRRAIVFGEEAGWLHGALLLGLAANCKNEGVALLVAVAIAVVLADMRRAARVLRLWPAVLLAAPWLLMRATHALATDLAEGSIAGRFAERVRTAPHVLGLLASNLYDPWFWVAIVAAVIIVPQALRARERFVLLATAIQLAFYVATYFATPRELRWHIGTSWPRLTMQIAGPVTYVVMVMLAEASRGGEESDISAREVETPGPMPQLGA